MPASGSQNNISLPTNFDCVGNPPRQTADPLAPPCVPFFQGNNGGATYAGVTQKEIRIVIHEDGGGSDEDFQSVPTSTYYDLAQAPTGPEYPDVHFLRAWQQYFNSHFQTYGRRVHFYVYFNNGTASSQQQAADAARNFADIHPFAALMGRSFGYAQSYLDGLGQHGVMTFGVTSGLGSERDGGSFARFPGLEWGFHPPVEFAAREFASAVCDEVQPYPVSFSGDASLHRKPRVYGLLYGTNPAVPEDTELADAFKADVAKCGVAFRASAGLQYTDNIYVADTGQDSTTAMANFQQQGVTTVLWPGGWNPHVTETAHSIGYSPEWIAGDDWNALDSETGGSFSDAAAWNGAMVVSPVTFQNYFGAPAEGRCLQAYLSVDPTLNRNSADAAYACNWYDSLLMLFSGIQVAGPHLNPASVGQGFRAIPEHASATPEAPACYYQTSDYTCEKDAILEWWDPTAVTHAPGPGGAPEQGCYRVVDNGRRYRPDEWPRRDIAATRTPSDPCTLWGGIS